MSLRCLRFAALLILVTACLTALPRGSAGDIPTTMSYEGYAVNSQGKALSGHYDLRISIYASPTDGAALWIEAQPKVQFSNGTFNIVLGRGTPAVPLALPFDQQYFIGVAIGSDPEMAPRVPMLTIPYSFRAKVADRVPDSSITAIKLAPGSVTDDKIATVSWSKVVGVNGTAGVPAAVWSLKGNRGTDPSSDFIGTTDLQDLVFRTGDQPRFNIHSNGTADFFSDFAANGSFTSRPTQTSGSFLFGDGSVGISRQTFTSNLRLFGPPSGIFWMDGGNFGVGTANPGSKLSVSGGLAVGSSYADMSAPTDGAIIAGPLGVGTSSPVGMLDVDGDTHVGSTLTVEGDTRLNGKLSVAGDLLLKSDLAVKGKTTFGDLGGSGPAYPVRVEGSPNGIEIRVISSNPNNANTFVAFDDAAGTRRGAIKGETIAELTNDPLYVVELAFKDYAAGIANFEVGIAISEQIAAAGSSTACVGLGACATAPIPSLIIVAAAKIISAGVNAVKANFEYARFKDAREENIGVTYSSGARDYAEWLRKANPLEKFFPGDIVGVRGGLISLSIAGAENLMVISTNPMVLGNVPPAGEEEAFEKVAFLGQVPVKVLGKVESGDFILASGDGMGIARRRTDVTPADYLRFVGIAWSASEANDARPVNVAVGLHGNDFARIAMQQDERLRAQSDEIRSLRDQVGLTHRLLTRLVPGFDDASGAMALAQAPAGGMLPAAQLAPNPRLATRVVPRAPEPIPVADAPGSPITPCPAHIVSRHDLEQGFATALETMRKAGATRDNDAFLRDIEDPAYKERFLCALQAKFAQFSQSPR